MEGGAEAESEDLLAAVHDGHGNELHAEEIERLAVDHVGREPRSARFLFHAVEDVREAAEDSGHRGLVGVDGNVTALPEIEGAHVIEAHHVIGVGVSEDDGIEVCDFSAQGLGTEIRRGVDQDVAAGVADEHRGAKPLVARVAGSADLAIATERRDADTGAGAEHRDSTGRGRHQSFCAGCLADSSAICT